MYLERRHWDIDLLEHLDAYIDEGEEQLRERHKQQSGIVVDEATEFVPVST